MVDIVDIARMKEKRDIEGLIDALQDRDSDAYVRGCAAEALGKFQDIRIDEPLINAFKDPNADVRFKVAMALRELGDIPPFELLIDALQDSEECVRMYAAGELGKLGDRRAVEPLISVLQQDSDVFVRENAANTLGKIGDRRAIGPLLQALSEDEENREYVDALRELGIDTPEECTKKIRHARGLEKALRYEDALKLYEELEFWDDAGRVRKLMKDEEGGKEEIERLRKEVAELKLKQRSGELTQREIADVQERAETVHQTAKGTGDVSMIREFKELIKEMKGLGAEIKVEGDYMEGGKTDMEGAVIQRSTIGAEKKEEGFKICPYCGEELNFPKPPKFCPYCKEQLR